MFELHTAPLKRCGRSGSFGCRHRTQSEDCWLQTEPVIPCPVCKDPESLLPPVVKPLITPLTLLHIQFPSSQAGGARTMGVPARPSGILLGNRPCTCSRLKPSRLCRLLRTAACDQSAVTCSAGSAIRVPVANPQRPSTGRTLRAPAGTAGTAQHDKERALPRSALFYLSATAVSSSGSRANSS